MPAKPIEYINQRVLCMLATEWQLTALKESMERDMNDASQEIQQLLAKIKEQITNRELLLMPITERLIILQGERRDKLVGLIERAKATLSALLTDLKKEKATPPKPSTSKEAKGPTLMQELRQMLEKNLKPIQDSLPPPIKPCTVLEEMEAMYRMPASDRFKKYEKDAKKAKCPEPLPELLQSEASTYTKAYKSALDLYTQDLYWVERLVPEFTDGAKECEKKAQDCANSQHYNQALLYARMAKVYEGIQKPIEKINDDFKQGLETIKVQLAIASKVEEDGFQVLLNKPLVDIVTDVFPKHSAVQHDFATAITPSFLELIPKLCEGLSDNRAEVIAALNATKMLAAEIPIPTAAQDAEPTGARAPPNDGVVMERKIS